MSAPRHEIIPDEKVPALHLVENSERFVSFGEPVILFQGDKVVANRNEAFARMAALASSEIKPEEV